MLQEGQEDDAVVLRAQHLAKNWGSRPVVSDISFYVRKGEVVGFLGPNGAGKTTAFYMLIGLIRPDQGQVFFKGVDVTKKSINQRAKMGLGYLTQEPSVFRKLTVEENILCILENVPISKKAKLERLQQLLHEFHLDKLSSFKAILLSGGERRRLEIARALVTEPSVLLLDEPFANIDPLSIRDLKNMIRVLVKKKISVLITDHNAREICSIADRSYLIRDGRVVLSGTVKSLLDSREARQTYFGVDFQL